MSLSLAITPNTNPLRAVCHDVLLVLAIAAFSVALTRIAVEIADPGGAFGPAPVFFAAGSPPGATASNASSACQCGVSDSSRAAGGETLPAPLPREAASGEPPRPRGFLAGETAEMRERGRSGWADLRSDFALATLSMRNPGKGGIVMPMPPTGRPH